MEWIDPKYASVVADLRQRQAAEPEQQCRRCRGTGILPSNDEQVSCPPCSGTGARPPGVRMFITT